MVKADVKRNYYADLELPTDASLEEIKKQYRKLGEHGSISCHLELDRLTSCVQP